MLKKRRILITMSLVLCLVFSLSTLAQAQPSDIQGHWAESQISDWLTKGLAQGYPDGSFKPDNTISRAEFISLTNHAFAFTATTTSSFSDVTANDWFVNEIAKSQAAGYITGYQDGTMRPNQGISRQEVATIIAKIAKLDTANNTVLNSIKDTSDIPEWSRGAIAAVVAKDLMHGYPDQTFRAQNSISRAEAIISLNNLSNANIVPAQAVKIYDKAGVYGPTSGTETLTGDLVISVAGVTLQNCKIIGNLTLAQGIGEGDVSLKNVSVQGTTYIKGGGANSVTLENCTLPNVTISKAGVRVVASGKTSVNIVKLENGATLVETSVTGSGFGTVTMSEIIPSGAKITLSGSFDKVNVAAASANVTATGANIAQLDITDTAGGSTINLDSSSKVNTISLNAAVSVTGQGTIDTAQINATGTSFAKKPSAIENPNNYSYSSDTESSSSGNGSGTNSGDGGGVAPLNLLSSDPEDGSTGVSRTPTIILTFDRGVVRDHWDTNQNCFSMKDKNSQAVDITASRATNYLDDSEKSNIYVTPDSALTSGMKYTLTISANLQANNDNTLGTAQTVSFTVAPAASGGGGAAPAAPTFSSACTNTNGSKIKVTFSKAMADPSGNAVAFAVSVNGNGNVVTAAAIDTDNNAIINLTLTTAVASGDAITVAYTPGTVSSADGGILGSFTAQDVTNTLVPAAPTFSSASTNTDGSKIKVTFSEIMADPSGNAAAFAVTVNGNSNVVTAAEIDTINNAIINLTLTTAVVSGDNITVAYTKGTVSSAEAVALESFAAQNVTNTLTPAASAAPVLIVNGAEVNTNGDISLTFDKAMNVPNKDLVYPANMAEICAQFNVKVNEVDNVVTAVITTGTLGKIKLVLTNKVTSGQTVTVSYTKGTEANQVKAVDGGILNDFGPQAVTNAL